MAEAGPTFTILMPVHRPPYFMPHALRSVLAQTRADFELFIICDGAPPETVDFARAAAAADGRIRVFSFPKGERYGEAYRDVALREARGRLCCQIADDDLWFPHHLAEIERLLDAVEFGNLLHVWGPDDGSLSAHFYDLADPAVQRRMREERWNLFGPTFVGYRLETYRRLPIGWSPAPPETWSDLFMWRKFLALPGVAAGSRLAVTALNFPASYRVHWPVERRLAEIAHHASLLESPAHLDAVSQQALLAVAQVSASDHFAKEALTAEQGKLHERLTVCEAGLNDGQAALRASEDRLAESRSRSAELEAALARRNADLAALRDEMAVRQHEIETLRRGVTQAEQDRAAAQETSAALSQRVAGIEASRSWRVTAPLRRLRELASRSK